MLLVLSLIFPCFASVFDLWVNIFMNHTSFVRCCSKILIPCQTLYIHGLVSWRTAFERGERAFEETPPTRQVCNVCKGVA